MLKIAHATWTKVSSAKLPGVRAFTRAERAGEALLAEWAISQPNTAERLRRGGLGDLRQMADFKGADDVTLDAILDAVIATLLQRGSHRGSDS